jgi:Ca2+-binding EF-hand superfamily protein
LVHLFDTVEEDDKCYDASWFKDLLHRLRNKMVGTERLEKLKESFEFFDEHHEGNLDTANFKTVIMENNVGLSV